MSIQYYIRIQLDADFSFENIKKMAEKGNDLGFRYYNSLNEYKEAAIKEIIAGVKYDYINGCKHIILSAKIDSQTGANIGFYENEYGMLNISLGGFGTPSRKYFQNDVYHIDLDYYIRIALDLCKDFAIQQINIEEL